MTEGVRVWVVDDDEAIRFVLERALTKAGYKVDLFGNVAAVTGRWPRIPRV
jgi:DNA-binding NtrC family response regulator